MCVVVGGGGGVLLLSLLNHCPFRILQPIVLTIRNNLQMFIYNKSLSMHTSDIPDQANVVNLLSTDPAVFHQSLIFPNYAMVSPILIVISMVVMYLSIGWAVFVICGICVRCCCPCDRFHHERDWQDDRRDPAEGGQGCGAYE